MQVSIRGGIISGVRENKSAIIFEEKWKNWFNDWFQHIDKCIKPIGKYFVIRFILSNDKTLQVIYVIMTEIGSFASIGNLLHVYLC